jgi:hypothetical protein
MARSCLPLVLRVATLGSPLVVWAAGPILARLLAVEIVGLLRLCTLDNLLGAGGLFGLGSRVLVPPLRSAVTGGSGRGRWLLWEVAVVLYRLTGDSFLLVPPRDRGADSDVFGPKIYSC